MTALVVAAAASGAELDRLTLDDEDRIAYRTGTARDMVETWRRQMGEETSDAKLLDALAGWSNGYVAIRIAGGDKDRGDDQNGG
jgi:hypothetical protein